MKEAARLDRCLGKVMKILSRGRRDSPEADAANPAALFFRRDEDDRLPIDPHTSLVILSAHKGLIDLDPPPQLVATGTNHRPPQLVQPGPGCLVTPQA